MAKTCPKCRSENTDTAKFCSNCATALPKTRPDSPAPAKTTASAAEHLAPGTVIGTEYEVIEKLGRGGMGEVYRALDRHLDRQVAIKALPEEFGADPERLARFKREAKLLAALNHPNIAAVHELEESDGRQYMILEMVEGETLQARLDRGAMAVDNALETCRQIALGLEAAHEKGIVHRDLKPGNIMVTPDGQVKILDFGLAKAQEGETTGALIADSPTITALMTEPGIVLGTAGYMSPEQARGRSVDKRADIWAFGCVLYECLTGQRAFPGETPSDIIAQILKGEPDWNALPRATPESIRTLLGRCLRKERKDRLHDIADARLEIEGQAGQRSEAAALSRRSPAMRLAAGAVLILLAGFIIDRFLTKRPLPVSASPVVTTTVKVEPGHRLQGLRDYEELGRPTCAALTLSRDGRFIIYSAIEEDPGPEAGPRLYMRRLDRPEAQPIAGTEGGENPFLSPDDRWVGFSADGKLKKVPVEGGVPITLYERRSTFLAATWGRDNSIVFNDGLAAGLSRIPAEGGDPEVMTKPDRKREELGHRLPSWLPDGKAVLFTITRNDWDWRPCLAVFELDTGEWRVLLEDAADARYVPTGHLVFLRQGTLMAVRFDPVKLEVVGQPVELIENVMQAFTSVWFSGHTGAGQFDISGTGTLIYATGGVAPAPESTLVWVDERGEDRPVTEAKLSPDLVARLSPDGRRIVYGTSVREGLLYVYDLDKSTNFRLTNEGKVYHAIWSPDGGRLLFSWHKYPPLNLYWRPSDGSSPMERLVKSERTQMPVSWSRDGKTVAIIDGGDIAMLDIESRRVTPFLNSPFGERYPYFSPDGRWLAYTSTESGREEVYVTPFPGPGPRHLISSEGGREPLWARDGKRLFYRQLPDQVWVADIRTDGGFSSGKPRLLFKKTGYLSTFPASGYDLSLDGRRFLMIKQEQSEPTPVTEMVLIQNWAEELKRLVPVK